MMDILRHSDGQPDLVGIIGQVRRRWRMKLALRGAATVLALGFILLLVAAYGLESARFSPGSIIASRVLVAIVFIALVAYFLIRPLLRRVSDEQVALYLEEHEPSLQASIVSAVSASAEVGSLRDPTSQRWLGGPPWRTAPARPRRSSKSEGGHASRADGSSTSAALVRRLIESAIEKCQSTDAARCVERVPLRRYATAVAATALVAISVFLLGPGYLRHALSALLIVSRSVEAAAPYRIEVTPGNATVPKGADQTITARLQGFDAEQASLMVRRSPTTPFEPLPLVRGENGQHDGMLFDLAGPVDYFVEAAGVRSAVFKLNVIDLPYVQKLELEYHFPAYTGLEPQKVEDGGDIAVLRGTDVRLRATPTMKTPGGRIALNDKESIALTVGADGVLSASFKADRDGFYRIELDAPTGERVAASPQYTIDVLTDQAPSVSFSKPGRDTTASPIEEVFVEATAEDDYGVRDLELVYSVNGGPEKTVKLFGGRNRLPEVTAGHTFYLEELNVQPGDSVSYFARAADNDSVQGAKRATSDLYFLRIRPFKKDFRPAQSMGGGGGGGGGAGGQVDALSEQQRQVIAATFNLQRDRKTYTKDKLREHTIVVALAQARLREQVEGLVTRMNSRLVEPDPSFKKIAELLPQAVTEMKAAEVKLNAVAPDAALPPEHRALQFLQKAEEEYELQVNVNRNAGGGGGGGAGSVAEDLADLFEMELDRMANQYETAERSMQQNSDQQLDELLEKLKELARRQEQEAERQRRRAIAGQASSGGGGAQQRALAEEAEEAARRLEKLSREENKPELGDAARRLREAADQMRRAAASGDANAAAQASAALERLKETERRLQRSRTARAERDVNDAMRQAEALAREQDEIAQGVRGLDAPGTPRRQEQAQQLAGRKDALESKLGELEKQLDRSAADASRDEREASRKLSEAAGTIRDQRIRDKIRYSKAMVTRGFSPEQAQAMENDIASGFDALRRKLGEAQSALGRTKPDSMTDALDKARRLARGMESLQQRTQERADQSRRSDRSRGSQQDSQASQQGSQQGSQGSRGSEASQQGSQGSQGSADGTRGSTDGRGGIGDTVGPWSRGGGWGDRRPWGWDGFSRDDIRQWRGEIRQWSNEAVDLRRMLRGENIDPKELDAILRALRELDDERVYQDPEELLRLQTLVTEGLKRFEYGLRRRADADGNEVVLSGTDEVPEAFRKLVEQYYRSLAKTPR